MSTAIFIGRFQPFHKGHLSVIQNALQENDHLIIAIGSSQESKTSENPFTANQRQQLIEAALKEAKIDSKQYSVIQVPDINKDEEWVAHLNKIAKKPYQSVYSGSSRVKHCFKLANSSAKIIHTPRVLPLHATKIRKKIIQKDPSWQTQVPPAVAKILKEFI